jgi:hypothetical protein
MTSQVKLLAAVAGLGLIGLSSVANAAPAAGVLTGVGDTLKIEAQATTKTENVRWTCWSHRGYRQCGHVGHGGYGGYRGYGSYGGPRVYGFYAGPRAYYGFGHRRHWR